MSNFNILMFGSRRAGKSSVLASMIDSFQAVSKTGKNKITLEAYKETKKLLDTKKADLKKIFEKHKEVGVPFSIDENPTDVDYTYKFKMTAADSADSHDITFIDIPGESLMNQQKREEIDNKISKSQIIIIAIDTPHLMENNGSFNNAFNITSQVYSFLETPKGEQEMPRMILFVPIKCEKYYHEGRMDEVNTQIRKRYELFFGNFGTSPKKELYTIAITPILTLGGVVFHDFLRDENGHVEIFKDTNIPSLAFRPKMTYYKLYEKNPVFSPKYCEQPVLYLLNFILKVGGMTKKEEKTRETSDKVIDGIFALFATPFAILFGKYEWLAETWKSVFKDKELIESAITATENIKTSGDGYEFVQNSF